jgi:hypothetical protein
MITGTISIHKEPEELKYSATKFQEQNDPWNLNFSSFDFQLQDIIDIRKNVAQAISDGYKIGVRVKYKTHNKTYNSLGTIIGYYYLPYNKTPFNQIPDYIRVLLDNGATCNYKQSELEIINNEENHENKSN